MVCRIELDMDARTVKLTINGVSQKRDFTESVNAINYIGFGVYKAASLFTELEIKRDQGLFVQRGE